MISDLVQVQACSTAMQALEAWMELGFGKALKASDLGGVSKHLTLTQV